MKVSYKALPKYLVHNYRGLLLLLVAWFIFFAPIISGQQVYFEDDLKILYYPLEHAYAQAQDTWSLPQWNNEFGFGHPLLAWGQLGFFIPLHVLLRLLQIPALPLLQISVVTYYAIGLVGMFVFLRRYTSELAAALGSCIYVFCGFNIGHLNHVNFYTGTMLLPWLLVVADRFIQRPTLRHCLWVSLVGAAITISAQPQIVLYTFITAGIICVGLLIPTIRTYQPKLPALYALLGWGGVAVVLALGLSTLALLPLAEFLPNTERGAALPQSELFEFSYPPYHAITLIWPYFFGDHTYYWGAKGLQELSAYVGIIPLLLSALAATLWQRASGVRAAALTLIVISCVFALGRYSSLYTWLVQEQWLTSLGVPSRWVFLFDTGVALLAALAIDDIRAWSKLRRAQRLTAIVTVVVFLALFSSLFGGYLLHNGQAAERLLELWKYIYIDLVLALGGLVAFFAMVLLPERWWRGSYIVTTLLAVGTLLVYGSGYNPTTPASVAQRTPPFSATLQQWQERTGIPARLYSAESIVATLPEQSSIKFTENVSPKFAVYQPLPLDISTPCLRIPYRLSGEHFESLTIGIQQDIAGPVLDSVNYTAAQLNGTTPLQFCPDPSLRQSGAVLSFTSPDVSPIQLQYYETLESSTNVYFVRVTSPTQQQLTASQKKARLVVTPADPNEEDEDLLLLTRHLNVVAASSSARWIGALSIHNYRSFIESFFANDTEAIDGDGVHALVRFRTVLNMAGVTHLAQLLPYGAPDSLEPLGFKVVDRYNLGSREARLYENTAVLPRAWLVPQGIFKPAADDTRHALKFLPYDPRQLVYIDGPVPPSPSPELATPLVGTAVITEYSPTRVELAVNANQASYLVVTDSSTPQWHTFIDGALAPYFVANTVFKAAQVPAGQHVVSFRYDSTATERALRISVISLVVFGVLLLFAWRTPAWARRWRLS